MIQANEVAVNWDVETWFLRDMCVTGCQSHRIAAEAIWNGLAAASERQDGALQQKVLTAKMAAEEVAALESLGALAWSVANRDDVGIVRKYLNYAPKNVRQIFEKIDAGTEPLRAVLRLPDDETLSKHMVADDVGAFVRELAELERVLRVAAHDYLALDGAIVRTYNKIKHGFVVVQRLDMLVPRQDPPTDWQQHVNVVTGITRNGSVRYPHVERSLGMMDSLMNVIRMCSEAWRGLAAVIIFLHDRKVRLEGVRPVGV